MALHQYQQKRNFKKTAEPKGKIAQRDKHLYIIQKHAASHLHYDFRLELDGVLKSWAVPKGPSLDPKVKRLAMQVEDHPIEYGTFEGIIPQGEYGGGTVMLWDKGQWTSLDKHPQAAYEKGHLRFTLKAEKLNGRWDLIRFKDERHWFLIKYDDEFAQNAENYDIITEQSTSVVSHQSIEQIAKNYQQVWDTQARKKGTIAEPQIILPKNLAKSPFPDFIKPQLATLVDSPPEGKQWLYEVKFDGYRILAFKQGDVVVLKSRNNKDWTQELHFLAEPIINCAAQNFILDGEVVLLDKNGRSNFQLLQNAIHNQQEAGFIYYLFDILYFDQFDLRSLPLLQRKSILEQLIPAEQTALYYSDHILEQGNEVFKHACAHSLEGIIAKQTDSPYLSTRSKNWLKIKCMKRQEFVIGGYSDPRGNRACFGALFLGVFNQQGTLDYVGKVGTGFSQSTLKELYAQLIKHPRKTNPFNIQPEDAANAHWVKPVLIAEVEFSEWTREGRLRHPSFKGIRADKRPAQVLREQATPIAQIKAEKKVKKTVNKQFVISHPNKIVYPEDKITKQDLLLYYESVSDYILPYLINRPLTLLRCPTDYAHCFYQRHYNKTTPKALYAVEIEHKEEIDQYIYLKDKNGLLNLVQMGVLEIHPWGSQIAHLEQPDIIVIDLDPAPDVPWPRVVTAAREIKEHLQQFQLTSFVKSTGGKGLHVVIPIQPEYDWDAVKNFTQVFVEFLEQLKPKEYTSTMSKAKRQGKIFIDYLRNQRTATAISAYSTRARIHAPVSVPLFWDELSERIEDNSFTIKSVKKRLSNLKKDPWADFWLIKQSLHLDKL